MKAGEEDVSGEEADRKEQDGEEEDEEEDDLDQEDSQEGAPLKAERRLKGAGSAKSARNSLVVKVGMVGDAQIGKTSLMVRYVEGKFDSDYIETLGVNFMEKSITLKNAEVTFSIWDLGGEREFISMLPLVCNDALVILFMFSLPQKSTLSSVREWYRQVRGLNKQAFAFLIGTKYDVFATLPHEEQKEITKQARKYARAMKAPLIFSSASHSINVQKIFKLIFGKIFNVDAKVPEIKKVGDPIIEYMPQPEKASAAASETSSTASS
ncbi:Septum-promoting GTP-binding protein 1 [Hondaea fermentalgiana]|uniref:Septum-promoting GTP-binding protein 1 n=1 Tax=Hondaea fermentalgiana TaxID=2315210 RepID=A0A2R5G3V5_9STRA|nr:Septum-promoting GTP-binding protein 1 [Hondaea fermentalgiana]|eukprot:GBG24448.1 Septum-promoting GTP-binding protein 1 [Hondaea fermentalgiana]